MKRCFIFFSHQLTEKQTQEIKNNLKCDEIIYLPKDLQYKWSNVEDDSFDKISSFLREKSQENDYALIQGEWGLTYKMINFAKEIGVNPIYAKTKREAIEEKDGEKIKKISYFEHIKFEKY